MRRAFLVICAVFAGVYLVSLLSLSAEAQSVDQYGSSDGTEAPAPPEPTAPITVPSTVSKPPSTVGTDFVSQGSVVEADSSEAVAARRDLAAEARLPSYTRVVDNTTRRSFRARGWKVRRGSSWSHGKSYVSAGPGDKAARFEVKIPSSGDYSVYAWWPKAAGNTTKARFGVGTASGTKWSQIDQRTEGGMWIKLGTYSMKKGERAVQVAARSAGKGSVVADAVAVVRGRAVAPPADQAAAPGTPAGRATTTDSRARTGSGYAVVAEARKYIKKRTYGYGACDRYEFSCTCLTRTSVGPFGHNMTMAERGQWTYGRSIRVPYSKLQPGDEVFFKEKGPSGPITHVGIYSGNNRVIHASSFFDTVIETEMKYIKGYAGAKRFSFR